MMVSIVSFTSDTVFGIYSILIIIIYTFLHFTHWITQISKDSVHVLVRLAPASTVSPITRERANSVVRNTAGSLFPAMAAVRNTGTTTVVKL